MEEGGGGVLFARPVTPHHFKYLLKTQRRSAGAIVQLGNAPIVRIMIPSLSKHTIFGRDLSRMLSGLRTSVHTMHQHSTLLAFVVAFTSGVNLHEFARPVLFLSCAA